MIIYRICYQSTNAHRACHISTIGFYNYIVHVTHPPMQDICMACDISTVGLYIGHSTNPPVQRDCRTYDISYASQTYFARAPIIMHMSIVKCRLPNCNIMTGIAPRAYACANVHCARSLNCAHVLRVCKALCCTCATVCTTLGILDGHGEFSFG